MKRLERLRFSFHGAGLAVLPPGSTYGPRDLRDYIFIWMIAGHAEAEWDGRRCALPPGSLALARPGTRDFYRWDTKGTTQQAYLHFGLKRHGAQLPRDVDWPQVRILPEDDILRPLLRHVFWLLDHRTHARLELAQGAMRQLLAAFLSGDILTSSAGPSTFPEPVVAAIRLALECLDAGRQTPTLGELARAAHISEGHLCRLFRVSLGCGPVEALRAIRLDQAAAMLATSTLRGKEIAGLMGFANPFHFSRCFRAAFGISPRAYREKFAQSGVVPQTRLQAVRHLAVGLRAIKKPVS